MPPTHAMPISHPVVGTLPTLPGLPIFTPGAPGARALFRITAARALARRDLAIGDLLARNLAGQNLAIRNLAAQNLLARSLAAQLASLPSYPFGYGLGYTSGSSPYSSSAYSMSPYSSYSSPYLSSYYPANSGATAAPYGTLTTTPKEQSGQVPSFSPVSVSPRGDAAVLRIRLPDTFGSVAFNGVPVRGVGSSRDYVTTALPGASTFTVSATWKRLGGAPVSETRQVEARAGKVTEVDFTRPTGDHSARTADTLSSK
jgi:hypothetical protein